VKAIKAQGGADIGMRTLLDALIPSLDVAASMSDLPLCEVLKSASIAAEKGAEATQNMVGKAGRSSYVPAELSLGWCDPGAVAIACIIGDLDNYLNTNEGQVKTEYKWKKCE
jgi:phosphoenolpyruvate---glycerone phosphotransferase subunit DhaL